jgi:predicted transcriptional regulator
MICLMGMERAEITDALKTFLRRKREQLGILQTEFTRDGYEVSRATVIRIETGKTDTVSMRKVVEYCVNLEIRPDELSEFPAVADALRLVYKRDQRLKPGK